VIEAVRISDRKTTGLPDDCGGTVSSSTTFNVKGVTASDWATGDLGVSSNGKHVSVFTVGAAFAAGTDPTAARELTLALGTVANLALDDGGAASSPACSAAASLKGAGIFRVRVGVLRLNQTSRTLEYGDLVNSGGTFAFNTVLSDIDDFQVRLDLVRHTVDATTKLITGSSLCSADSHTALTAIAISDCGSKPMNALANNGDIVRLAGLRLGLILRSRGSVDLTSTFTGLFDRTATIGTDRRMRRTVFLFAGLPNALL
jgi:hypothetical protein